MRKLSAILLLLPLIFVAKAHAESRAEVNISNHVSSNTNTTTSVKNNIRIETNGHVTEYSSDKAEDIEIKAVNDKSEIKVNGESVNQTPSGGISATPTNKPTEEPNEIKDDKNELKEKQNEFVEAVQEFIEKIFSIFD